MLFRIPIFFLLIIGLTLAYPAVAEEHGDDVIGSIATLEGEAIVIRGDEEIQAEVGTRIHGSDVVRTEKESSLGIVFKDDTTVSLGEKSELGMKEFDFRPSEGAFSMVLNMVKGTFVYVSGRIAKLSPESVEVETPVGVVAVRGTRFLAKIP
jgi:hypothetical protein